MSLAHMIILGIIALIVIPPDKLPEMARQLAKLIFELKRSADQILGDLKQEAMIKPEDILDKNIKEKFEELQKSISGTQNFQNTNTQKTNTSSTANNVTSENTNNSVAPPTTSEKKKDE